MNYQRNFYSERDDFTKKSAKEVVGVLMRYYKPNSVVDVGCGVGTWLATFKKAGTKRVMGIDGENVPLEYLKIKRSEFVIHDLNRRVSLPDKFDLSLCLEVGEHLSKNKADTLVDSLTSLSPVVLFSAAIPHQGGVHHINEQWPSYWIDKFERKNYVVLDIIRPEVWDNNNVVYWYRQNILLFVKISKLNLINSKAVANTKKIYDVVHPETYIVKHQQANNVLFCLLRNVRSILPIRYK